MQFKIHGLYWKPLKTHIHTAPNQLIEKYTPKHGMILEFISALDDSQWPTVGPWPCGVACPPSQTLRWGECMKCSGERKRYRHILVYPAEAQQPILNPSLLVLVEKFILSLSKFHIFCWIMGYDRVPQILGGSSQSGQNGKPQGGRECAPADVEEVGRCPNPCAEDFTSGAQLSMYGWYGLWMACEWLTSGNLWDGLWILSMHDFQLMSDGSAGKVLRMARVAAGL